MSTVLLLHISNGRPGNGMSTECNITGTLPSQNSALHAAKRDRGEAVSYDTGHDITGTGQSHPTDRSYQPPAAVIFRYAERPLRYGSRPGYNSYIINEITFRKYSWV